MLLSMALLACNGPDEDTGDTQTEETATETGDTGDERVGWTFSGVGLDFMTQGPAATAGLCLSVVNPELALVTSDQADLEILGSAVIGEDGTWTVEGIITDTEVGLFLMVTDCDDSGATVPTGTGVPFAAYESLEDGGSLTDLRAVVVSQILASVAIEPSFGALTVTTEVKVDGLMMGFVEDSSGQPVDGAVVSGDDGTVFGYLDPDNNNGGLFVTDGVPNAHTLAAGGGWFMSPGAPVTSYSVSHDTLAFEDKLFGTLPGLVTVFKFTAQ